MDININYLVNILGTNKLEEVVANIDAPPIDLNLAIWHAEKTGQVEIDVEKGKIKSLKAPEITFNSDLADKLLKTIQHYTESEINVTRGRLNSVIKEPGTDKGYPWHDYLTSMQYLIDTDQVIEMEVSVPKNNKRPYRKFVFLCLPGNPNEDWNRNEVNKWIENWNKK